MHQSRQTFQIKTKIAAATPAQDSIRMELERAIDKIGSLVGVQKPLRLSSHSRRKPKRIKMLERKLKRKIIDQKAQVKAREGKTAKV